MTMLGKLEFENLIDEKGNPDGGYARGIGIDIEWQAGPLGRGAKRVEPNGAFVETVILAAKRRLEFYQTGSVEQASQEEVLDAKGKFACEENASALMYLEKALYFLNKRTEGREAREVEGTHEK